ncbi:flagellar hook protein FlgE [Sedimentitalea todarodis]|uniref:Flagellar hook protein FlgE n=1 Tax=Sedimentitalea todarodis TaxID=1631240 RepID=A0ABU3VAG4_9RHOB|nr:flagellar hook-basal body complex protein [Sedimentitalea todarodis]MDU9003152.1 flagellar hook-basal body complex protein [Sedimentitalea todarodis]
MTISSSLNAGIAGLSANSTRLASISDNIANSSTYGYKRVESDFHSMVISSSGGSYSAGGVRATSQRMIDEQGPLVSTSNSTDLAVRGRGMLPVAAYADVNSGDGDQTMMLTSTGSFRADKQGYLKTESGLVLLGWPALPDGTIPSYARDTPDGLEPVQLLVNEVTGEPTTSIDVSLNLPATDTNASSDGTVQSVSIEYFDNTGTSESISITMIPTVPASGDSNEWTMVLRDTASGGATIGEYVLTFDDSRANGGTLATATTVSGGAYDPTSGSMIVNVDGGPIEITIGGPGHEGGLSQLSDTFAPISIEKDGFPVGNMTGVEVDANGLVRAQFDNGAARTIFQIPLVDMPNPNGMISLDQQTYMPSPDSGSYFMWDAGDGPTGEIVAYAREESTTDVASELTSMIRTQRAYSSNAKVIQTVDEMLQETTNIKR